VTTVIGIGNRERGDDAAGLLVTDALRAVAPPRVRVLQLEGDPTTALDEMRATDLLLIVDATGPAGHPGRVHRLRGGDWPGTEAVSRRSTHGLGCLELIRLAAALGSLPERTVVYGIEGEDFAVGHPPSAPVVGAVPEVVAQILEEVR
jgi:hydrogenase maturation protease